MAGRPRGKPGQRRTSRICECCKHFRSDHPYGERCWWHDGRTYCDCKAFTFTEPDKPKPARRAWTEEEDAAARRMLELGDTYAHVAAKLDRPVSGVRQRFPGFGADMAEVTAQAKHRMNESNRAYEARQRVWREARNPARPIVYTCMFDGCERRHYARGLCYAHWDQERRGVELRPIRRQG